MSEKKTNSWGEGKRNILVWRKISGKCLSLIVKISETAFFQFSYDSFWDLAGNSRKTDFYVTTPVKRVINFEKTDFKLGWIFKLEWHRLREHRIKKSIDPLPLVLIVDYIDNGNIKKLGCFKTKLWKIIHTINSLFWSSHVLLISLFHHLMLQADVTLKMKINELSWKFNFKSFPAGPF